MERISNVIGKPVINIFDGILEGYVKNMYVDNKLKKVTWLCVFDDETEEEKLISTKTIYNFDCDAITIKNSTETYPSDSIDLQDINAIGYKIYTSHGTEVGKITDIDFDEKFHVQNLFVNGENVFDKTLLLKVGKNIIIQKNQETEKLCHFAPKQISDIKPTANTLVSIQTTKSNQTTVPPKILTSGYGFLIGRKVGQNIYAENGTVIAKKQSLITSQVIDMASKNGRLNELTKYSLA